MIADEKARGKGFGLQAISLMLRWEQLLYSVVIMLLETNWPFMGLLYSKNQGKLIQVLLLCPAHQCDLRETEGS